MSSVPDTWQQEVSGVGVGDVFTAYLIGPFGERPGTL